MIFFLHSVRIDIDDADDDDVADDDDDADDDADDDGGSWNRVFLSWESSGASRF